MSPNYLLRISAQGGLAAEMERALSDGADINLVEGSEPPVLHLACLGGNVQCIHIALQAGADLEAEDETGLTAVQVSIQEARAASAIALLAAGADGSGLWKNGRNLLHWCAIQDQERIIERGILQGANVNGCARTGHTPVALAAELDRVGCVKELLRCGANPLHLKSIALKSEIAQVVAAFRARSAAENA